MTDETIVVDAGKQPSMTRPTGKIRMQVLGEYVDGVVPYGGFEEGEFITYINHTGTRVILQRSMIDESTGEESWEQIPINKE